MTKRVDAGASSGAGARSRSSIAPSPTTRSAPAGVLPPWAVVGIVVALVAAFAVSVGLAVAGPSTTTPKPGDGVPPIDASSARLVRDNSRVLSNAVDARVSVVAFLDFESEAARAAFPVLEQLRMQYAGRVTFVVRYFPLDNHVNSMRAARAVEAAAQQGQFEAMYTTMYETQNAWGEQEGPADDTFRRFATDLGLDLARWDAAYGDDATIDRVNFDVADGRALGVDSTPTFFVNDRRLASASSDAFRAALDDALTR